MVVQYSLCVIKGYSEQLLTLPSVCLFVGSLSFEQGIPYYAIDDRPHSTCFLSVIFYYYTILHYDTYRSTYVTLNSIDSAV